jgi:peptide/nickel transport system permease protein
LPDNDLSSDGGAELLADPQAGTTRVPTPEQGGIDREFTVKARTQRQLVVRRFLRHKLAVASLIVLICIILFAFLGAALWHYKYGQLTPDNSVPPSPKHPFGTDNLGTDEFADVMHGAQRSLEIAFFVAIVATVVGAAYGAIAGFYRGVLDNVMMRFVDLVLTIPIIAVGALLANKYGQSSGSWWALAIVLAAFSWPAVARVVRAQFLSLREKEFVEAARALGAKDGRIIFRHILPNVAGPLIVMVTLLVAAAILTETALSFLGFGIHPPDTSLGLLISDGQNSLLGGRPWLFYFPGIFIILIALTVNFIGDGLRDAFDPTQTRVRA